MRKAESSCSVFTGFARYSDAPASRHFSRSPFMALAVRAMIGKRRNDAFCRMTWMVLYPSISGIMISINTMATSGVDSSVSIASRPVPAVKTVIPAFQHAAERENISHVIVHHENFLFDQ